MPSRQHGAFQVERNEMNLRGKLPGTNVVPLRRHEGGYVAQGPGFYIWDEDPIEVARMAREYRQGNFDATPTARLLILRKDFEPTTA